MMARSATRTLVSLILLVCLATTLKADPPWMKLVPFKRVESNPNQAYWITEENGPWLILATSFAGPGAQAQAQELVQELRSEYKLPAYLHKREFDFSKPVQGLGLNKYGGPKMMRHNKDNEFEEYAVLVGNYLSVEDPQGQKDLEKVKYARPDCLDIYTERGKHTTQRFIGIRELQRRLSRDDKDKGPMRKAFMVRNPLVPKEYFVSSGLDPLVLKMNKGVEHSLLDCPGPYTVKVATFRGETHFAGEDLEDEDRGFSLIPLPKRDEPSKLELAADMAHRLTVKLRAQGVEAYEFHDRFESIVTVGSFQTVGTPRQDGKTEINPAVHRVMQAYGAHRTDPGKFSNEDGTQFGAGLRPRTLDKIPFDIQPLPVKVPRQSVGDQYANRPYGP